MMVSDVNPLVDPPDDPTCRVAVLITPPWLAVIVVVPLATAVATPLLSIVATEATLDVHVI
jgi:hypothetical protein